MKRYRVFAQDYDTRAFLLTMDIKEEWEEKVKILHRYNREQIEKGLLSQYGIINAEIKRRNFIDLGRKPFSILAFHNIFFEQVRSSFVIGAYYPALTGTSALGERILNHLIIKLRNDYKNTPEYKKVYKNNSFDNWAFAIDVLDKWKVFLPEVTKKYKELEIIRHKSIHFRPEVDHNDRELALRAIKSLQDIINHQFSGFGAQPWFITTIPGEIYIKKEWEDHPFIKNIYLPNCSLVGPKHIVKQVRPSLTFNDKFEYPDKDISDEVFSTLRLECRP